jgi:hypothetical protein
MNSLRNDALGLSFLVFMLLGVVLGAGVGLVVVTAFSIRDFVGVQAIFVCGGGIIGWTIALIRRNRGTPASRSLIYGKGLFLLLLISAAVGCVVFVRPLLLGVHAAVLSILVGIFVLSNRQGKTLAIISGLCFLDACAAYYFIGGSAFATEMAVFGGGTLLALYSGWYFNRRKDLIEKILNSEN